MDDPTCNPLVELGNGAAAAAVAKISVDEIGMATPITAAVAAVYCYFSLFFLEADAVFIR